MTQVQPVGNTDDNANEDYSGNDADYTTATCKHDASADAHAHAKPGLLLMLLAMKTDMQGESWKW